MTKKKPTLELKNSSKKSFPKRAKKFNVNAMAASVDIPDTPQECVIWRDGDVRKRIRAAVAEWAGISLQDVSPSDKLGALAKGEPWGIGQQIALIRITNDHNVFAPFASQIAELDELKSGETTVKQWEKIVWEQQTPPTFCKVFGS